MPRLAIPFARAENDISMILAIDQGTSGTKAVLVADNKLVCVAEVPVRPRYLAGGQVEVNPDELWESVLAAGHQVLRASGYPHLEAVALANQGETVLAWDHTTGVPVAPALVWQDTRTQSICEELRPHQETIVHHTGLALDPYFSAPKMSWLARRHPSATVTTTDTWLAWQLTKTYVCDVTTASRSLLLDVQTREWQQDLIRIFGLDALEFPVLVANDEIIGQTKVFAEGGRNKAVPVTGLMVDQQAALVGQGCLAVGQTKCTYGTGAFVLANVGSEPKRSEVATTSVAYDLRQGASPTVSYCLDGQVYTAGSALRWLTELGLLTTPADLDSASASATTTRFVPGLAGLGAPWWQTGQLGSWHGLGLATTRGELVRSVIDGIAGMVALLVQGMAPQLTELQIDGGLARSLVLRQMQADLLQVPIVALEATHATAVGAAALASLALGHHQTLVDAAAHLRTDAEHTVVAPQWSADQASDWLGEFSRLVNRQ
jgi:glycerol kinase